MTLRSTAGILCSLMCLHGADSARAQGADFSPAIGLIDQSRRLALHGRATRDPLALIVAARLLRESGAQAGRLRPATSAKAPEMALANPRALLAEARQLGKGRRDIARLADETLASAEKGRERGPLYEIATLAAGGTDEFATLRFAGGKRAEVYVDANQPVGIIVYDATGQSICRDDRGMGVAYCWWPQAQPGEIRVEIVNRGAGPAVYRLLTN